MQRRRLVFSPLPIPIPFRSPVNRKQRDLKTAIWNRDRRENHFPGGGKTIGYYDIFPIRLVRAKPSFPSRLPVYTRGRTRSQAYIFPCDRLSPSADRFPRPTPQISESCETRMELGSRSVQDEIKSRRCKSRRVEKRGDRS